MAFFTRDFTVRFVQRKARASMLKCRLIPRLVAGCTVGRGFREVERSTVTTLARELIVIGLERPAGAIMRERFGLTLQVALVTAHL